MRHGDAPGVGDPAGWRLDDCATQRNLSERGRDEARAVGARLRAERIAIARVLSSPWCRCVDTATLVGVGPVQVEPAFANAFVLRDQREALREGGRAIIGRWRGPGVLLVVTHGENIRALTGRSPATAEIVVVAPGGDGALREIGSLPRGAALSREATACARRADRVAASPAAGRRSLDDDHVDRRDGQAQLHRGLVVGRLPAVERGLVRRELDDDVARAAGALGVLEAAGADDEAGAEARQRRGVGGDVGLVGLGVGDVDARDPVTLGHGVPSSFGRGRYGTRGVAASPLGPARRDNDAGPPRRLGRRWRDERQRPNRTVAVLNRLLEAELAGVVRYTHYSFLVFGFGRIPIVSGCAAGDRIAGARADVGDWITRSAPTRRWRSPLLDSHQTDIGAMLRESLRPRAPPSRSIASCSTSSPATRSRSRRSRAR